MLFSGDLGDNTQWLEHQPLIRHRWDPWPPADYVVTESTYGDRVRPAQEKSAEARLGRLNAVLRGALLDRCGPVIIPAFAIQRTQDILADLTLLWCEEGSPFAHIPVVFDAPMAERVNRVLAEAYSRTHRAGKDRDKVVPSWLAKGFFERVGLDSNDRSDEQVAFGMLREMLGHESPDAETREARASSRSVIVNNWRQIWTESPGVSQLPGGPIVVVTGGGMADGGKVTGYLQEYLGDAHTTVLFTGHCSPGSVGGRLLDLARLANDQRERLSETLDLQGKEVPAAQIRASIEKLSGYSGHTDQEGLLSWLFPTHSRVGSYASGETVFITHGDSRQRRSLHEAIWTRSGEGFDEGELKDVLLPSEDDGWFDLDAGAWEKRSDEWPGAPASGEEAQDVQPSLAEFRRLQARIEEFERHMRKFQGRTWALDD
jgi:metallo-beta-lactamase family protein